MPLGMSSYSAATCSPKLPCSVQASPSIARQPEEVCPHEDQRREMPKRAPEEEYPQAQGQAGTLIFLKLLLYQSKEYFLFKRINKQNGEKF